ncbi:MAG: hypothetical protein QXP32_09260, partial [Nitrososphaeria archaeon]
MEYPPYGWINGTGTLIPIVLDVKSDCSGYIDEETPSVPNSTEGINYPIKIRRPDDSTIDNCYPWQDWYNGTYNCTYNTTYRPPGYYDIILSSAKQYFIPNTTYYYDWFELTNLPPTYQNPQVSPSKGGWGETYNFSIEVKDTDLDNVNCSLFVSTDDGTTWRYVGSQVIQGSSEWQTCRFIFTRPYGCNSTFFDIGNDNWFRFNLTDDVGQTTIVTIQGPEIIKDNITITHVYGNNTNITRASGFLPLKVYVYDISANQPVGKSGSANVRLSFNVTKDGVNYIFVGSNQTYSSLAGNVTFNFDPSCEFDVGYQQWFAFYNSTVGAAGECYYYNESERFTIGIVGQLVNYITSPNSTKNRFVREEENITWRGYVTTDCSAKDGLISNATVAFEATHVGTATKYYCDEPLINENNGYYRCLFINNVSKPTRSYKLNMSSSNVSWFNPDWIEVSNLCRPTPCAFFIVTRPSLSNPSVSYTQDGGWGESWQFGVTLSDADLDVNNVSLWIRNITPAPPQCPEASAWPDFYLKGSQNVQQGNIVFNYPSPAFSSACVGASFEFFFNTTDGERNANTSLLTFTVQKDDVNITLIEGDSATLNRSLAPYQENVTFSIKIYDTDRNVLLGVGTPGTIKFYVTTDPNNPNSFVVEEIVPQVGPGGFVNHTFPKAETRCNYGIGPQRWRAEFGSTSTIYKATNSTLTYGDDFHITLVTYPLQVNVIAPDNQSFRRNIDLITYIGNVSDDCGGVKGANVEFRAYPEEINPSSTCLPNEVTDYNNGTYSCSRLPSDDWQMTYHNLTINASKQYYEPSKIFEKVDSFVIVTNPTITLLPPTSKCRASECLGSDNNFGWGEIWNFSAIVQDLDQGAYSFERMNISLWIDFGSGYQLINSTICYAPACQSPKLITFLQTFDCEKIGTWNYKINVSDYWGYKNESSSEITINPNSIEVEYISSPIKIDREIGTTQGTFVLRIKDVDRDEYLSSGRNASFFFTKDGSTFNVRYDVKTNSSGYINITLDPDCSYSVGIQKWDGGILGDYCYYSENYTQRIGGPYDPPQYNISGQIK